ncbi:MAG: type 4a pilus biogenesis protein PilO [Methylococcales bacterium]|jgi:type IV pilus assembly protein PilO|nr:type 4a pilus biogenesis protein PilO [Methylococcales bacterium]MBT7410976.1 type 4a pilus biogenesis protein PilO [Methylococcales bacterium]
MSFVDDLNNLDMENVGSWPLPAKLIAIIFMSAALAGTWYMLDTQDQMAELEKVEQEERRHRQMFEGKQKRVVNLDLLKQQLKDMEETFQAMRRQLPNKTEVDRLLDDVSQTVLASGLEQEQFQPQKEILKDDYAELPIRLKIFGQYHEMGDFVSGVAALPRIVTVNNFSIVKKVKGEKNQNKKEDVSSLLMTTTVTTYRYLDEEEE